MLHHICIGQLYTDKPFFVSVNSVNGKFQVHTNKLQNFNGVKPYGIDVEVGRWLFSEKMQDSYGIYSKWGLLFNYTDFNQEELGYTLNSIMFIEPLLKARGRWRVSVKFGAGIAFMSNPYSQFSNSKNLTYSTKLAFPLVGSANVYMFLNKRFALKLSGSFRHISNGGIKEPNLGINYPIYGLGVEYLFHDYKVQPLNTKKIYRDKKKRMAILVGYSQKRDTISSEVHNIMNLMLNRSYQMSKAIGISMGGLLEFDQNQEELMEQLGVGLYFGNEFIISDIRFGQQLGAYIKKRSDAPNLLFQNYYLRYLYRKRWVFGADLKAHGIVADYLLIQVGFVISD